MHQNQTPEVWMRGPIEGVPPLLQPVAHALLQVSEDIDEYITALDEKFLWTKPLGMASVGFHLQHITGVIDRMFTYAAGQPLSAKQLTYLSQEGRLNEAFSTSDLVKAVAQKVLWAIDQLRSMDESQLTETRYLGRKQIPTTYIGLLFHAAEHSQRHMGQLLVTVRIIRDSDSF